MVYFFIHCVLTLYDLWSSEHNIRVELRHSLPPFKVNTVNDRHYQRSVGSNDSEGMRRNGRPEGREQSTYRFISPKVTGKCDQVAVGAMEGR